MSEILVVVLAVGGLLTVTVVAGTAYAGFRSALRRSTIEDFAKHNEELRAEGADLSRRLIEAERRQTESEERCERRVAKLEGELQALRGEVFHKFMGGAEKKMEDLILTFGEQLGSLVEELRSA